MTYDSWAAEKITLASAIAAGCSGGGYAEGAIIMCATISAMASMLWEGGRDDRKRFVEVVTRFNSFRSDQKSDPKRVSVPLLLQALEAAKQGLKVTAKASHLLGGEVDKTEDEIVTLCPGLPILKIRNYSYANLLYKEIRCGFVHEYQLGEKATATDSDQMRDILGLHATEISYVNESQGERAIKRRIHFPLQWIAEIARGVGRGLDGECEGTGKAIFKNLGMPKPDQWWTDG